MDLVSEIRNLVGQNLPPDKFVVEVLVSGKKIPKRVLVIIDGDQGVNIDDCADLSRVLSKELDEHNYFGDDSYLLEVSTPGLDHPLKLKRQYYKNTGRKVEVLLKDGVKAEGVLKEVSESGIKIEETRGKNKKKEVIEHNFPFDLINSTKIQIVF